MHTCHLVPAVILVLCSCGQDADRGGSLEADTVPGGPIHVLSPAEGVWATTGMQPWRLEEDLRIGVWEGDSPYVFGSIRDVFPDSRGRIWVMDQLAVELRVFEQDGTYVRTIGGPGGGPGEFGSSCCAFPGPDGEVWVESRGRWQRFDTAGALLGGQMAKRTSCAMEAWLPDGRFLAASVGGYSMYERKRNGEVVWSGTVQAPPIPDPQAMNWVDSEGVTRIYGVVPLTHRPRRVLGPRGNFWITDGGGPYRIRKLSFTGDTLLIMERPYDPIPVPEAFRDSVVASLDYERYKLERNSDRDRVPHRFPPFNLFMPATDGVLWVFRYLEDGQLGLDVFDQHGRFLGPVQVPPEFGKMGIRYITSTHMYGFVRDELDVQYVVRIAIEKRS